MRAEEKGPEHLHGILQRLDKAAALRIHANDIPKLIRAIEICLASRQPMSKQWEQGRDALKGFRILRIGLDPDRQQLYLRINQRVQDMFAKGLVEETQGILQKYGAAAGPLSSIGYKEVVKLIAGELNHEEAVRAVQQAHRNYAKRQMTWFRREPDVKWIAGFGHERRVIEQANSFIRESR
jgi:tRNA dimethylallyltransferase